MTSPYSPINPPTPGSAEAAPWGNFGLAQESPDATPQQAEQQAMQEYATSPQLQQYIQQNYGYAQWILQDPELMSVLAAAAVNGWGQARIMGALQQTNWWKQYGAAAGQFYALQQTDPASAAAAVSTQRATILTTAQDLGVNLSDSQLTDLATQSAMFQWNSDQINQAVRDLYQQPNPQTSVPVGQAGQMQQVVQSVAGQYLTNASQNMIHWWTTNAMHGGQSPAELQSALQNYLGNQAKVRFPWMKSAIEQGMTPQQFLDPYTQQAAKTLSISPDSIDWTQPKWQGALLQTNPDGTQTPLNTDQFNKVLMQNPIFGYAKTQGAIDQAYTTARTIQQTFGAVAY